ncbi:MAG: hypothetical protein Q9162_002175 [Coniocarpon cinnabarinum]
MPQLPRNFESSSPLLQYQGAEALIYKTQFPIAEDVHVEGVSSVPAFLKFRPSKPYRHPTIDAKLTRHRILAEARVLTKLRRERIAVPAIYALDWEKGWLLGEWIEGQTVRVVLDQVVPQWLTATECDNNHSLSVSDVGVDLHRALIELMAKIGALVGKMHAVGVVHGDLTTSNLLLKADVQGNDGSALTLADAASSTGLRGDVYLIDFGLVDRSIHDEDRAVDLYVLERAFGSTHPQTQGLFQELLKAYSKSYKGAGIALKRLEDVRMRGRKKIMIG